MARPPKFSDEALTAALADHPGSTAADRQLHGEFADAGAISAEAQVHATSAAHLRELLAADHRYVFTLIHKFRLDAKAGETSMPVLSDRSDVIVIIDEAHRSQYDTLALNMPGRCPTRRSWVSPAPR